LEKKLQNLKKEIVEFIGKPGRGKAKIIKGTFKNFSNLDAFRPSFVIIFLHPAL